MGKVDRLTCVICAAGYDEDAARYACPACGDLGTLRVSYNYGALRRELSPDDFTGKPLTDHWRYLPLLPVGSGGEAMPLRIGGTPLYPVPELRRVLRLDHLWVKDESGNPSGSLKDRASAVAVIKARELSYREIATASTGNAAASLAALSAAAGMPCHIFVPKNAPRAKLAQLLVFGADVIRVDGGYDDAFKLCIDSCAELGWYNRNTGYNPYTVEGKKTVAMEIAEQLGWEMPETIIVPVGDGCILSGVWKGAVDLERVGLIGRLPRIVAAQAEGSQAIKQAFDGDGVIRPVEAITLADSVSVSVPRNGVMAVQDLRASGGAAVAVSDGEILEAMSLLGRASGIFGEPAGVLALAALRKLLAEGRIGREERVAILVTGGGLKDIDAALKAVRVPDPLPCTLAAVKKHLES